MNAHSLASHWLHLRLKRPVVTAWSLMALSAMQHPALAQSLVASITDGAGQPVAGAVVALSSSQGELLKAPPGTRATLDQVKKQFQPHILAIQAGTLLYFPNSDNIRHQVYSFSQAKRFETKLYAGATAAPVLFDRSGVAVLGCNIHDEMRAYVYVLDTPYFAVTDITGHATVNAPVGNYVINIWHPRFSGGQSPATTRTAIGSTGTQFKKALDLAPSEDFAMPAAGTP